MYLQDYTHSETLLNGHLWKWRHIHEVLYDFEIYIELYTYVALRFMCILTVCLSRHWPGMVPCRFGQGLGLAVEDRPTEVSWNQGHINPCVMEHRTQFWQFLIDFNQFLETHLHNWHAIPLLKQQARPSSSIVNSSAKEGHKLTQINNIHPNGQHIKRSSDPL